MFYSKKRKISPVPLVPTLLIWPNQAKHFRGNFSLANKQRNERRLCLYVCCLTSNWLVSQKLALQRCLSDRLIARACIIKVVFLLQRYANADLTRMGQKNSVKVFRNSTNYSKKHKVNLCLKSPKSRHILDIKWKLGTV